MKKEYIEKIYAGWLAKVIGVRYGAPVESWTYEKIKKFYGTLDDYPQDYKLFAADDDTNGPLFFLRGLEDSGHYKDEGKDFCAQDVADALLNYAPYEHGFFWWGGYGISTEHTAYLNLRNGIPAPKSGSIEQNGAATAEQIGGQIFIDTWGLVAPGNPDLAARLAREAASVTHDRNGIYGGIFIAACISYAFEENDIRSIIEKGLSYIPSDCEYTRAVRSVMHFYDRNPESTWEDGFKYIYESFGYDRYPGNCHIIPNICVMILALLYGEGDFDRTLAIGCMCGWDTDCNVGNISTIMGVRGGLNAINYRKFREPVNDFLACSSVIGSLNNMDIPYGALYITKLAYALADETPPEPWKDIIDSHIDACHFEFPGSTHAMHVKTDDDALKQEGSSNIRIENSSEAAHTGARSLKFTVTSVPSGSNVYVYKKTCYCPDDFSDDRYNPCFSPLIYPGQTIHGNAFIPDYSEADAITAGLYFHDGYSGRVYYGDSVGMKKGEWASLSYSIPQMENVLIDEIGFVFTGINTLRPAFECAGFVDDFCIDGCPDYTYDMAYSKEEKWPGLHREISQFTRLTGHMYLAENELHLSCSDFAECYTGAYHWTDYSAEFLITPRTGSFHMVNFRVQGGVRSYAIGLLDHKIALLKNSNGYRILTEKSFEWAPDKPVRIRITASGNRIEAQVENEVLQYTDTDHPYLSGQIGLSVRDGSHVSLKCFRISPISCE